MAGLDEQVQEIKSDVLAIATELRQLEEKLLYPSDTQVAVFVSLEGAGSGEHASGANGLELDSVQIQIDGKPAARHVYSLKEVEAMRRGGVQRVYTGNLATGGHQVDVVVTGKFANGALFEQSKTFPLEKKVEPKVVALTLDSDARIELGHW